MPSVHALPALVGVRLATPDDLSRVATVAAAGFFHSPTFRYQRVHYAAYPDDTLLSYWTEYLQALKDPSSIVLVVEDFFDEDEGESVYPALRGAAEYTTPGTGRAGSKVVVGVASVSIRPGSTYQGMFQPMQFSGQSKFYSVPANPNRDLCRNRVRVYNEATAPAKARHLQGQMRLSTLAVHPAYWGRGHASRLVGWSTRFADLDGVPVGISAVPQGATIAAKAGFEERELVRVQRACVHNEMPGVGGPKTLEVELWVAIRRPCNRNGTPVSEDSATSLDTP